MPPDTYLHGFLLTALILLGWFHTTFPGKVWGVLRCLPWLKQRSSPATTATDLSMQVFRLAPESTWAPFLADLISCHICFGVWISVAVCCCLTGPGDALVAVTWVPVYHLLFKRA